MTLADTLDFRPIQNSERATISFALALLNRTHGVGLFDLNYLDERIACPDSLVLGAFSGEALKGIAVARVIDDFTYYLPFQADVGIELKNRVVGSLACASVIEPLQGQGLGQALAHKRLAWLRERDCDVVVGVSWESGLKHTSKPVFEKSGFRLVRRVEGFYIQSSLAKPFDCPGCQVQPCSCAALMYRRDY